MALFGKEQQSSGFGAKSISSPQKPLTQKPAVIQKSIPSKPVLSKPTPQKSALTKPVQQKPNPAKPIPPKPTTLFGEKKDWSKADFISRAAKNPFSSGGRMYSFYERKKMLEKTFSPGRFSTYISEGEAKTRLRELRSEEYRAKTGAEKAKLSQMRKYFEGQTGLKGKY